MKPPTLDEPITSLTNPCPVSAWSESGVGWSQRCRFGGASRVGGVQVLRFCFMPLMSSAISAGVLGGCEGMARRLPSG